MISGISTYRLKPIGMYFSSFLFCVLLLSMNAQESLGQSKRKRVLLAQKQKNVEKIKILKEIIDKTSEKKEASLGKLNAITEEIETHSKQIGLISENQNLIENEVKEIDKSKVNLSSSLEELKKEYAEMVFNASKNTEKFNKLSFLFASSNFNQLLRRYKYLSQYSEARIKQVKEIQEIHKSLVAEQLKMLEKKKEQSQVLNEKLAETQKLESLKNRQGIVVELLSSKEKELREQLQSNKSAVRELENLIGNIVNREIKRSRARRNISRNANNRNSDSERSISMNNEELKLANSFNSLKGKMPYPVRSGFISSHYGIHRHPILKSVQLDNNGVDIQTSAGNDVRVVYDGIVQMVVQIPGMASVVTVQHGNYFTVYSKLSNVTVSTGQRIKMGKKIGKVAADSDGTSEINFQIWRNSKRINPEAWLR